MIDYLEYLEALIVRSLATTLSNVDLQDSGPEHNKKLVTYKL
jgi:hypothetical protein